MNGIKKNRGADIKSNDHDENSQDGGGSGVRMRRTRIEYTIARCEPLDGGPVTLQCAIKRRRKEYRKVFPLAQYASEAEALAAARSWRDEQLATLRPIKRVEFACQLRPNNTSGVPGVMRLWAGQKKPNGKEYRYEVWVAVSPNSMGRKRSRMFSIKRYGDEGAYARAVAAREAFLAELEGYRLCNVPEEFVDTYVPESAGSGAQPGRQGGEQASGRLGGRSPRAQSAG